MSRVEEIERAVEKLPLDDFMQLASWFDRRRTELKAHPRDHSAFLNSYAAEDEGLYDDCSAG